jgi:NADPH2:quinone reductase
MKAIGYTQAGPKENLKLIELPIPKFGADDLLVEIKAVALNPVDVKVRKSMSPQNGESKILGWDAAGIVKDVGANVKNFKVGDEVYYAGSIARPGTNSQFHAVDAAIVAKKPKSLNFAEATSLPLTSLTAWEILFDRIKIKEAESGKILIIGGAGGVGSMAIQLLKEKTEMEVYATAAREESAEWVRKLGADFVVDHSKGIKNEAARLGVSSFDVIVSFTHTDKHFADILELIKPEGRFGLIDDAGVDLNQLKKKSISIHWESMFTRSSYNTETKYEQGKILSQIAELVDARKIVHTMTENLGPLTLEKLQQAHGKIESTTTIGKIVLEGFV